MRLWDGVGPLPCAAGFGMGTHLLVATQGGWGYLCMEKPERWQTMGGVATDDPLIIPNSDEPTCETCALLLMMNKVECLTAANWPITWVKVS